MKPPKALALTRREFVEVGAAAGAGLVLGFYLPSRPASPASGAPFAPNAFLEIERNGTITISVIRSEMGQGVLTTRSEEHTSELQSHSDLVCRLLLEKKKRRRCAVS